MAGGRRLGERRREAQDRVNRIRGAGSRKNNEEDTTAERASALAWRRMAKTFTDVRIYVRHRVLRDWSVDWPATHRVDRGEDPHAVFDQRKYDPFSQHFDGLRLVFSGFVEREAFW